jgi:two-component system, response regulator FlrC
LGGRKVIPLDVRVLATSNRVMREEVERGRFREDLFYRLHVFPINIHPLRERKQDILPLARFLLRRHAGGQVCAELTKQAEERLLAHSWPGNIRELDNVMQRALIMKRGSKIEEHDLIFELTNATKDIQNAKVIELPGQINDLSDELRRSEQRLIIEALQAGNGNRKYAAMKLGISQRTLRYKLARMRDEGVKIPRGYSARVM